MKGVRPVPGHLLSFRPSYDMMSIVVHISCRCSEIVYINRIENFMFVSNRYFNNLILDFNNFIPSFRVHLKHCSSYHNSSSDLEFYKNVPKLETMGAKNVKKKQSEGNTLLCYEYLFYLNTQVQMIKSFNSLLIQTFPVSALGTS